VGYGDIVPVTKGGKLFATIYILVAGTILLNNMSLISMIPLELRKRRIERTVLTQFGDLLDDDALHELASGPLIQRLHLSANRPDGLNECTREMFALAMLVRLGKVTEQDISDTFSAFNRLDVNHDGVLNSRSIIAGMIHRSKSKANCNGGMKRVGSTNSLAKTPHHGPPQMYGSGSKKNHVGQLPLSASSMRLGAGHRPASASQGRQASAAISIPTPQGAACETTMLLNNDTRVSLLSRSQ
jgi:Ion channel